MRYLECPKCPGLISCSECGIYRSVADARNLDDPRHGAKMEFTDQARSHVDALLEDRDELRAIARWLNANGLTAEWESSGLSISAFVIAKLGWAIYGEQYAWHPDNVDGL